MQLLLYMSNYQLFYLWQKSDFLIIGRFLGLKLNSLLHGLFNFKAYGSKFYRG